MGGWYNNKRRPMPSAHPPSEPCTACPIHRMLRLSIQRANGQYRDHLVGQLTIYVHTCLRLNNPNVLEGEVAVEFLISSRLHNIGTLFKINFVLVHFRAHVLTLFRSQIQFGLKCIFSGATLDHLLLLSQLTCIKSHFRFLN